MIDILAYRDSFQDIRKVDLLLLRDGGWTNRPLITIAIPTYKRVSLLEKALLSALAQRTLVPYEVVVIDNHPNPSKNEDIEAIARRYPAAFLRVFRNTENLGMFGNWNRCIDLARGEWVTILNDDDLLDLNFISEMIRFLSTGNALIGCQFRELDERSLPTRMPILRRFSFFLKNRFKMHKDRTFRVKLNDKEFFINNPFKGSLGIIFRRSAALEIGGFNSGFAPSADFAFFIQYCRRHGGNLLPFVLSSYRIGCNETLKGELVELFVSQSLAIREELSRNLIGPKWLIRLYSRFHAAGIAQGCRDFWQAKFDYDGLLVKYSLPRLEPFIFKHFFQILIRIGVRQKV